MKNKEIKDSINKIEGNLKTILEHMFYYVGVYDISNIDFKKHWYLDYNWTEKHQEDFEEWLTKFLIKNWKGVLKRKPYNKNERKKAAQSFILNYGFPTRPLKIDDFMQLVPFDYINDVMSKRELKEFNYWTRGSTCSVYGIYRHDLEDFLNNKPNLD